MKEKMNFSRGRDWDRTARQPLLENSPKKLPSQPTIAAPNHASTKYTRLENEADSPNGQISPDDIEIGVGSAIRHQQRMMREQEDTLHAMGGSVSTLKSMSNQIGTELDEQAVMLDDFGTEMENTDSKLDSTMKKMAKVLHMSNEKRQWTAIGVLSTVMVVVVVLLFIL